MSYSNRMYSLKGSLTMRARLTLMSRSRISAMRLSHGRYEKAGSSRCPAHHLVNGGSVRL